MMLGFFYLASLRFNLYLNLSKKKIDTDTKNYMNKCRPTGRHYVRLVWIRMKIVYFFNFIFRKIISSSIVL
jgi:hypothetical protein